MSIVAAVGVGVGGVPRKVGVLVRVGVFAEGVLVGVEVMAPQRAYPLRFDSVKPGGIWPARDRSDHRATACSGR
jgi:hypothetical protein